MRFEVSAGVLKTRVVARNRYSGTIAQKELHRARLPQQVMTFTHARSISFDLCREEERGSEIIATRLLPLNFEHKFPLLSLYISELNPQSYSSPPDLSLIHI